MRKIRRNKNKNKKTIKKILCEILFVIYMIMGVIIMANSFDTKYFFLYLAGTMISFVVMLFISAFYCPDVLGSSNNKKSNSTGGSAHIFSDGSD